ncbi:MAG: RluA family pseudouridine synthase [Ruminococcus sp.]|nr:RluA family pseudouridine synthase [Ruminococcus sp.]
MTVTVLFEDEHLVVAVKPYDVLSEAHAAQPSMPALLKEQCGCEVYPVHRLDKTTEGLMVYAKTRESAAKLSAMIQKNEVEKIYLAAVEGKPDEQGELTDLLYFDRSRNKSYVVRRERRGVKSAKLRYECLGSYLLDGHKASTVRVRLLTGRTHQIRVQFASRHMPLVGDRRYGSRIPSEHIALCAAELRFTHPITGEELHFSIEPTFIQKSR